MSYRVRYMYHPSLWVPDREQSAEFFQRVFGRPSVKQEDFAHNWARPGYPNNYCIWTMIDDCWIDCIDSRNYVIDGKQIFPDLKGPGRLQGWGWYVDGMEEIFSALKDAGIAMEDQLGQRATGDRPPSTVAVDSYYPLFMSYFDEGMRYEFIQLPPDVPGVAANKVAGVDERLDPDWTIPPVSDSDPLGIERTSHHTVLTGDVARAKRLVVDILGGEVVHQGENPLLGTDSTWIAIGRELFEYAVPKREGTLAWADWNGQGRNDTYHTISFKVRDLDKAAAHLTDVGLTIAARDDETIIVEPATALGVPWSFTTASHAR